MLDVGCRVWRRNSVSPSVRARKSARGIEDRDILL
jgi:hypothetical protein